jgi:diaminohydroxyphosphoribosylaminopyrimidine deaminase/5-amino-6-(5-phosphoribosylamino)uracil reductase
MIEVEKKYLEEAVKIAEQSKPEPEDKEGKKVHPKVGCLIIKNNEKIAWACRNMREDGDHAESTALRECSSRELRDAILITTLEPCTVRKHNWVKGEFPKSCVELILHFGIRKVVIGIVDPNPDIRGKGISELEERGIEVAFFPPELRSRIYTINKEYIKFHRLREKEKILKEAQVLFNFVVQKKEELLKNGFSYDEIDKIITVDFELLRRSTAQVLL